MGERRGTDGFSLVELMIAIAIMSILVAVSFPTYMMFARRARASEALNELGEIRSLQVSYKSINDTYLTLPKNPPGAVPSDYQAWGNPGGNWDLLGFDVNRVRYQYSGTVGSTGDIASSFILTAQSDLDGEGEPYDTWTLDDGGNITHTDRYK